MGIEYGDIESEVKKGCPHEEDRIDEAVMALDFFNGNFEPYREVTQVCDPRLDRQLWVTNFVVRKLTENLYKRDPIRELRRHPEANNWLQKVYKSCSMFGKWHAIDQASTLTRVGAFQIVPTEDPQNPVKVHAWDGSQLVVYTSPDDPTVAAAIVTIDIHDCRRRYTVWTNEWVGTYETEKWEHGQTAGYTIPKYSKIDKNPYKTLPFSFVHYSLPTSQFWTHCPGPILAQVNLWLNDRLTQISKAGKVYLKPPIVGSNISPTWTTETYEAGGILIPTPGTSTAHGESNKPELKLLEFDQTAIPTSWEDIEKYMDHSFDTMGVPGSAFRMVQSVARSGESIKAEQIPLYQYTTSRQPIFAHYEEEFAKKVLEVVTAYPPKGTPVDALKAALEDFDFSIRWAESYSDLPSPERDREDLFNLQLGLTDEIEILMRRNGFSEEEALQHLKTLANRKSQIAALIGDQNQKDVNYLAETLKETKTNKETTI